MKHRPCGNGKGDIPRPIKDREKFDSNWDNIFKKKHTCNGFCGVQECNDNQDTCNRIPALNPALRTYDGKLGVENKDDA